MNLCDLNVIKLLLSKHGFSFSKGLGQNFLCQEWVPYDIAEGADITPETCVLEVGPGIGTLTTQLASRAKKVVAVELDKRLPDLLAETLAQHDNVEIVSGDILKTNIPALVAEKFGDAPAVACANLPYYITTPAIEELIKSGCFSSITVMVQKEVAERICSGPGRGEYGAFSVFVQYHAEPEIILDVPRDCFIPAPKVDSAVVRMRLRKEKAVKVQDEKTFFRTVRGAFGQRRKTLLNSLGQEFGNFSKDQIRQIVESCGIDPGCRGETLTLAQFGALSDAFFQH